MENLLDGRRIAAELNAETRARVEAIARRGAAPQIVFVRVGEDPASRVYVSMKERKCEELGLRSRTRVFDTRASQAELLACLAALNSDPDVDGILVQAPLPPQFDATVIVAAIAVDKDVDGFHPVNFGRLLAGDAGGFVPCTAAGVHELLLRSGIPIAGAHVVVLGRGNIVGKPTAALLMRKGAGGDATVTVCHSRSRDIGAHCRRADILVAAIGRARFVTAEMVKPGAAVIDVGVNRVADPATSSGYRLVGDVDFDAVQPIAGRITPNPGGVGPMTIAMLMRNTVRAAELRRAPEA